MSPFKYTKLEMRKLQIVAVRECAGFTADEQVSIVDASFGLVFPIAL